MSKKTGLLAALSIFFLSTACTSYYEDRGGVFGTTYQIKYRATKAMTERIGAELRAFDLSLNPFNPNSVLSKVNRNEPVEVDDRFATVFNKAQEVSANTGGMFDATCAPFINLWGFGFSKEGEATPEAIDSLMQFVGFRKVRLEGRRVVKDDERVILSFSAIAKGYACDVVAAALEAEGVTDYMVEIGGEVVQRGVNDRSECWRTGIRRPESGVISLAVEEVVQMCEKGGIATSGDYLNFYIKDGKRYAHTINPLTGYPAEQNILSSTVVAKDCITADAYATAFTAMGLERAAAAGDSVPGLEYFFIYTDETGRYKFRYSAGMVKYLPNRKALSILEGE